jgi:AcrR family transcriptional regulator
MADGTARRLRADAQRNRDRVLRVAAEVFAAEGLAVPVHEIARRAGVGTGTVSRHFPTKEQLYAAILLDRIKALSHQADTLAEAGDPGLAFYGFFAALVREGAAHRGLAQALAGAGYDLEAAAAGAGYDVAGKLRDLLARAQQAGAVRADVGYPEIKALMTGCLARGGTADALDPMLAVICRGLRPDAG